METIIRKKNFLMSGIMVATLLLTACVWKTDEYPDALVVLSYMRSTNSLPCGEKWYVLPNGESIHEEILEEDVFTEMATYVIDKKAHTIRIYEHQQILNAVFPQNEAGYMLTFDLTEEKLHIEYLNHDNKPAEYEIVPGITGVDVERVDWKGVKRLFQETND